MTKRFRMHVEPDLDDPILLLAFEGWNDAGESATAAVGFVSDSIQTVPLAEIDPEEFYDFTVRRPDVVRQNDGECGVRRRIEWPSTELRYGSVHPDRSLVVGLGIEPHLRWRTYCDTIVEISRRVEISRVVLLGSYLADVVYSQPVLVTGVASDPARAGGFDIDGSGYHGGPTGIVGVLAERFEREGFDVTCLWAGLPHYITESPNPRGALALIQTLERSLGFRLEKDALCKEAASFEERVSRLVSEDRELSDYVRLLKKREFAQ